MQVFTLRTDLTGPTGVVFHNNPLLWRTTMGYRRFIEGNLYDARDLVLLGGGIEIASKGVAPLGPKVSISAGIIFGENLVGYQYGLGVSF